MTRSQYSVNYTLIVVVGSNPCGSSINREAQHHWMLINRIINSVWAEWAWNSGSELRRLKPQQREAQSRPASTGISFYKATHAGGFCVSCSCDLSPRFCACRLSSWVQRRIYHSWDGILHQVLRKLRINSVWHRYRNIASFGGIRSLSISFIISCSYR